MSQEQFSGQKGDHKLFDKNLLPGDEDFVSLYNTIMGPEGVGQHLERVLKVIAKRLAQLQKPTSEQKPPSL